MRFGISATIASPPPRSAAPKPRSSRAGGYSRLPEALSTTNTKASQSARAARLPSPWQHKMHTRARSVRA
eukprot:1972943-Pyramimonas_sp.AAC.1